MQVSITTLGVLCALMCVASLPPAPPVPVWPDQFTSDFLIRVGIYGPEWSSAGKVFYDWNLKTFRSDFLKWCLPLFDTPTSFNNYSCTFLATKEDIFFVNITASTWEDNECCLFAKGLGAVPPNWMSIMQYNGTAVLRDISCDVWWMPGTSDPENQCVGYWDAQDKIHTPVQFFGLTSVGPTAVEYMTYNVGPPNTNFTIPNKGCYQECKPPTGLVKLTDSKHTLPLPPFPSCG